MAERSFRLRAATADDAARLAELGRDSFVAKFGHLYRREDLAAFLAASHAEPVVAGELGDSGMRVMLAERDGDPTLGGGGLAGYCKLVLAPTWREHARGRRPVELKQLYTAPDATGGGIGAALLDWALSAARAEGADEIQLSVWAGNDGAQRFYRRHGFDKVADIEFWVGQQRDEEFLFALML
jgi:ribosomal protein S18 acetylase RimI-like enzyme